MEITEEQIEKLYVRPVREAWRADHAEMVETLKVAAKVIEKLQAYCDVSRQLL
jgi:hypothetical protein